MSAFRTLVIAVALLGCHDKQLEKLSSIKDEVCACKTAACGEAAMQKVPQHEVKSTRKMQRVAHDMMDCMKRLYDGERPTTDPDAEAPAASGPGSAGPASAETP